MKRTRVVLLVVIAMLILLPLIIFGGFIGYAGLTTCYTQHILRKATPDAVECNRQAYETNTSHSYDMCFYKFTQYNAEYVKDWQNTITPGGKTRIIDTGLFIDIITIDTITKCAMVEYHYKSDGAWQKSALSFVARTPNWGHELEIKNPLKDSVDCTSIYFNFDTIINDFDVRGILYPKFGDGFEACMFFHSHATGKEYAWTTWDNSTIGQFLSKNVSDIYNDKRFKGFKNGDWYTFHYNASPDTFDLGYPVKPNIPILYSKAEYIFYDVDFDGKEELLIGYYHGGGAYGYTIYDVYEVTDSALVMKRPINISDEDYFFLSDYTSFDSNTQRIINGYHSGCTEWGEYVYQADERGSLTLIYDESVEWDPDKHEPISKITYYQ